MRVLDLPTLTDVDSPHDAHLVAAIVPHGHGRFAAALGGMATSGNPRSPLWHADDLRTPITRGPRALHGGPLNGTWRAKKEALEAVGVLVGRTPSETARLMRDVVSR